MGDNSLQHVFIVNPAAGKGRALKMIAHIEKTFEELGEKPVLEVTDKPGHATLLAKKHSESLQPARLYAVGGDGTLNEVLNGITGDHVELGIIPCGSGNDTVRSLYSVLDPFTLIEKLPLAQSRNFDMGMMNDRTFLNIGSIGFDAEVAYLTRHFKRIPLVSGSLAYVLGILAALIRLRHYNVTLSLDGQEAKTADVLLCAFANGRFYGSGMMPAPHADLEDGLLDLCQVERMGRLKILRFFPAFKKGQHESMKEVSFHRFQTLTLESQIPIPVNFDGEVIKEARVTIKVLPGHIRILIP